MNEMTVKAVITADTTYRVEGDSYEPVGTIHPVDDPTPVTVTPGSVLERYLRTVDLCNDSQLIKDEQGLWKITGGPTEGALKVLAAKIPLPAIDAELRSKIPFDSQYKYMSTLYRLGDEEVMLITGAPDVLFRLCQHQQTQNGLEPFNLHYWEEKIEEYAREGLRMVAAAWKPAASGQRELTHADLQEGVILLGIAGTIARAVHEGRRVYDNLKKTILFVIPSNIAQALLIIIALLAGNLIPLTPVLILWMNMATSATLSFGLAFEAGEKDIMNRPPRKSNLHVMDGYAIWRVVFVGLMIAISAFVLEAWLQPRGYSAEFIRTVLLQTLVTAQWFYMLNCRVTDGFSLSKGLLANKGIWIVSGVLLALQLLIIYAPFMQMLFGTEALPFRYWIITFLIGFAMFMIVEAEKVLTRRWRTTKR